MTDTVNKHEMRVVALKRSGHHAIIQWMYANVGGGYLFLNQCRPGVNPFDLKHISKKPERRFISNIEAESWTMRRCKLSFKERSSFQVQNCSRWWSVPCTLRLLTRERSRRKI